MTQGERIRAVRKYYKLTLEKFGKKLGVGKTAISKLEKNERNLTDQMAKSICREFKIDKEWLRSGEDDIPVVVENEAIVAVSDLIDKSNPLFDLITGIMIAYQKLDDDSQKIINQSILDALARQNPSANQQNLEHNDQSKIPKQKNSGD